MPGTLGLNSMSGLPLLVPGALRAVSGWNCELLLGFLHWFYTNLKCGLYVAIWSSAFLGDPAGMPGLAWGRAKMGRGRVIRALTHLGSLDTWLWKGEWRSDPLPWSKPLSGDQTQSCGW